MLEEPLFLDQLTTLPAKGVGLAVLGYPIKHSISPQLHGAALEKLSEKEPEFRHWKYQKIEVLPDLLPEALPKLADLGYRGLNLTIPHKVDVLPLIDAVDPQAKIMGAVNTLSWENNGWKGYNTDGVGLSRAVSNAFGKNLKDFNVLVLGAGGASRAAVSQCLGEGCQNLAIYNRSTDRANQLLEILKINGFSQEIVILDHPVNPFENTNSEILIINATSLGLQLSDASPIDLNAFPESVFVYDMVYNPPMTKLLQQAKEKQYSYSNGLGMLVGQAARSLEIWTGREISENAMRQGAKLALS